MNGVPRLPFAEVWLVDFEFHAPPGERPAPICMVAREWRSGRTIRLWKDELAQGEAPYPLGSDSLFVAYYASAELGCHLAVDWPMPVRILDLCAEFHCKTAGLRLPIGPDKKRHSLLCAMIYHGLDCVSAIQKQSMQELAIRGGPFTKLERKELLAYCETDVVALAKLLPVMLPTIDLPRALLRGRYMAAAARMEHNGTPVDMDALQVVRGNWTPIQGRLAEEVNNRYGVYVPRNPRKHDAGPPEYTGPLTFSSVKWAEWLAVNNIPWPRLPSGALDLSDKTFRQMAGQYSAVAPIRELRHTLSQLRLNDLAVGNDGRNRCLLSAFQARTGRNQPSNSRFIFGPSVWLRGLIRPEHGKAVAYIDWEQQEFGIAAALSGDVVMKAAYASGDPYLAFARQAGAVPIDATKESHKTVRDQFKVCALAVQYGMAERSLANTLGQPEARARELLQLHRQTYPTYWRWSQAAVDHAMLRGYLHTVFGWRVQVGAEANPRSLANFPMQANGAEMLRLACCLATERGIKVCAPVHDAVLIEAEAEGIEQAVVDCQACMAEASRVVLDGFELRTDTKIVRYPDRYMDPRGEQMWQTVQDILAGLPTQQGVLI